MISAEHAINAYLFDEMSLDECRDYAKANGLCATATDQIIGNLQMRTDLGSCVTLWRRGLISYDELTKRFRRQGGLLPDLATEARQASGAWPQIQQIFAGAFLGAYSDDTAAQLQLDANLDVLQGERVQKALLGAGLEPFQAKEWWRNHWLPLDTATAIDLYHRAQAGFLPEGVDFDSTDLRSAIAQSNVTPRYRDAIYETRWLPPQRRIILQQLEYAAITSDQAKNYLIASGLKPDDADAQLKTWLPVVTEFRRKRVGAGGVSSYLGMFASGIIGTSELQAELYALGLSDQEVSDATDEARAQRQRKTRSQLITWLHGKYIKGHIPDPQAQALLSQSGLDGEDVASLLQLWRIELEVNPKEPSVNELLDWHCRGILSDEELVQRIAQLGYSMVDVARIIEVGNLKCAATVEKQVANWLARPKAKISANLRLWQKLLSYVGKQVGSVNSRTKTRAGALLSVLKSEIEGSPPPAKSLAGRAAAQLAAEATANGTKPGAAVAAPATTPAPPALPPASGGTGTGAVGTGPAQTTAAAPAGTAAQGAGLMATVPSPLQGLTPSASPPGSPPAQTEAQDTSGATGTAGASGTSPG
jgi:hypothetical protein